MSFRLLFTFPIDPGIPGGGPIHFLRLAREFVQAGADLTVVVAMSQSYSNFPRPKPAATGKPNHILSSLEKAGIPVHLVDPNPISWWLDGLAVRRKVAQICKTTQPDAVLGWDSDLAYLPGFLRARGIFLGMIAAASYSLWWGRKGRRLRWLHRRMDELIVARTARRADLVFANSKHTRSEVVSLFGVDPGNIRVVHPPLSEALAKLFPSNDPGDIRRLIYFGRLTREKGVYDLIEALGCLRDESWELRIAGSGDQAPIEEALQERGIADRVTLLGNLEEEDLGRQLQWAQLAVLPSHMESFGLSVAEAQLCGLPVIAYDIGPITEVTAPGHTSWAVPLRDIDALTDAIREVLLHPEEANRRACEAYRFASDAFLAESSGARILREICDKKGLANPLRLEQNSSTSHPTNILS